MEATTVVVVAVAGTMAVAVEDVAVAGTMAVAVEDVMVAVEDVMVAVEDVMVAGIELRLHPRRASSSRDTTLARNALRVQLCMRNLVFITQHLKGQASRLHSLDGLIVVRVEGVHAPLGACAFKALARHQVGVWWNVRQEAIAFPFALIRTKRRHDKTPTQHLLQSPLKTGRDLTVFVQGLVIFNVSTSDSFAFCLSSFDAVNHGCSCFQGP
jgi:hypothetical protein